MMPNALEQFHAFFFAEITRLEQGGGKEKDKNAAWINVHPNSPQTIAVRVYIPVKEYPKVRMSETSVEFPFLLVSSFFVS